MNRIYFKEHIGFNKCYHKVIGPGNNIERNGMGTPIAYYEDENGNLIRRY